MAKSYTFLSDPSHGWLRVNVRELQHLGLLNKISPYSYVNGVSVYLEEDCDAGKFIEALKAKGVSPSIKARPQVNKPSHIRGYKSYNLNSAMSILKNKYNYKVVS